MKDTRLILCGILALGMSVASLAAEVSADTVRRAIGNWRARNDAFGLALGTKVSDVRRISGKGVSFHVVRFAGGGSVIAPADDTIRPVIFISDGDDFDENSENPIWDLLVSDLTPRPSRPTLMGVTSVPSAAQRNRSEWADLLDDDEYGEGRNNTISDVRVGPLVSSRWAQGSVKGYYCYNYYTPNNWPCGCVATALGQIVRYFQFPTDTVPAYTSTNRRVDNEAANVTASEIAYDWSLMPAVPSNSLSLDEATRRSHFQAIGRLLANIGTYVGMNYCADGSGSNTYKAKHALVNCLGYASAQTTKDLYDTTLTDADCRRLLISNFDAGLPVQVGLANHSILADGYGFNGESIYYHLNFGWGETSSIGWYRPPSAAEKAEGYNAFQSLVYNIFKTEPSTKSIASGRVTDGSGNAANGVTVQAVRGSRVVATTTTNAKGIYSFFLDPGTYTFGVSQTFAGGHGVYSGSVEAEVGASVSPDVWEDDYDWFVTAEFGNAAECDIRLQLTYDKVMPPGVPSGYVRLEYLKLTGQQWIDTGICPTPSTWVQIDFEQTDSAGQQIPCGVYGMPDWNRTDVNYVIDLTDARIYSVIKKGWPSEENWCDSGVTAYKSRHTYVLDAATRTFCMDDQLLKCGSNVPDETGNYPLYLGAANVCDENKRGTKGNFYGAVIAEGETIVRNYVPCRRVSDNAVGFYETVRGTFSESIGTAPFKSVGTGWRVSYIENTFKRYINTGIIPDSNTSVEFDFGDFIYNNNSAAFFAADEFKPYSFLFAEWNSGTKVSFFGNAEFTKSISRDMPGRYKFTLEGQTAVLTGEDGTELAQATTCDRQLTSGNVRPILIFRTYGQDGDNGYPAKCRVYAMKITNGIINGVGGESRNFVPYMESDGTVGLRDFDHEGVFCANVATVDASNFTWGGLRFRAVDGENGTKILRVYEGELLSATDLIDYETGSAYASIEMVEAARTLNVAKVTSLPSLKLNEGTLSFADGTCRTYAIDGLEVKGGTTLEFDAAGDEADRITGGVLFASDVSPANPVKIRIAGTIAEDVTLIEAEDLPEDKGACFVLDGEWKGGYPMIENGRLVMKAGVRRPLPADYRRVPYLESSGTQWIDTGWNVTTNTKVVCTFGSFRSVFDANGGVFGDGDKFKIDRENAKYNTWGSGEAVLYLFQPSGNQVIPLFTTDRYQVIVDAGSGSSALTNLTREVGTDAFTYGTLSDSQRGKRLVVFARGLSNTVGDQCSAMRLYGFDISEAGVLKRNFIPARDANGNLCLYDTVTDQPFYNQGTGTFYTESLPEGYEPLPYLQSTGTQWIETGYKVQGNTRVSCDIDSFIAADGNPAVFGTYHDAKRFLFDYQGGDSYKSMYLFLPNGGQFFKGSHSNANAYHLTVENGTAANSCLTIVNAPTMSSGLTTTGLFAAGNYANDIGRELAIFAAATAANAGSNGQRLSQMKLYFFRISENGEPKRDFVPARERTTGRLGLYDQVEGRFYGNCGTGADFISKGYEGQRLTYVRATGEQYVDLGYTCGAEASCDLWFGNLVSPGDLKWTALMGSKWGGNSFLLNIHYGTGASGRRFRWLGTANGIAGNELIGHYTDDFHLSVQINGRVSIADMTDPAFVPLAEQDAGSSSDRGATEHLTLFWSGSRADQYKAKMDLYRFVVGGCDGGKTHDYVPYVKNGVVGIYDEANDHFPAPTGTFVSYGNAYNRVGTTTQFGGVTLTEKDLSALLHSGLDWTEIEKIYTGTLDASALASIPKPLKVSMGAWSLVNGAAATQTVSVLTLASGVTNAFDIVGTACDCLAVTDGLAFGADVSETNRVKIAVSLADVDWANEYTLMTGLQAGDERYFELTGTTSAFAQEVSQCVLRVEDGALVLRNPSPVRARWEKLPDTETMSNQWGWVCYNAHGTRLPDVLPQDGITELFIPVGTTAFNEMSPFPAHKGGVRFELTDGEYPLAANADWRDLDLGKFAAGQTVDLRGHDLELPSRPNNGSPALAFTDTSAPGEGGRLIWSVPENKVATNAVYAFTGSLRFEKRGAGTLVMTKGTQTYTGGTLVSDGLLTTPQRLNVDDLTYAPFEKGFVPFGPQNAVIEICTNGTFDIAGNYCYMKYAIVLAGGTLKNSVTQGNVHDSWLSIGNLTLTADSTLLSAAGTHLGANKSDQTFAANLGGHVLDVQITAGDFYNDPLHLLKYAFTNGTVRVSKGGWFRVWAAGDPWTDCTLEYQSGALDLDANLMVENLIQEADTDNTSGWNKRNAGRLFVTGTYKPIADYYHNFTLKSGVTIDLTEHAAPFVIAPAYDLREGSGKSTFAFETGGTFALRLGTVPPPGTRVIDWSEQPPTGWENLKFIDSVGRYAFRSTADGVEVRTGFAIRVR